MGLLIWLMASAPGPACPNMEGVWAQGRGERILIMEQDGCRLSGTVAEPTNQLLHVRGFWNGSAWTMAATRTGVCTTTAWGAIRSSGDDRMIINVQGSDGLCGADGAAGAGPETFDVSITYRRMAPRQ